MPSNIILILGAGANVGAHVAAKFAQNGYKVALAARSINPSVTHAADLSIKADFSNPASIKDVFAEVKSKLGLPSVVVYNAGSVTFTATDPLSTPVSAITNSLSVNTISAYAAAHEAVIAFKQLPSSSTKTFIYTGNILHLQPQPVLLDLGIGKAASAHLIRAAAVAYEESGYRFYFGDERKADGSSIGSEIHGAAHGDFYFDLAQKKDQGPWNATFVAGKGYVDFDGK